MICLAANTDELRTLNVTTDTERILRAEAIRHFGKRAVILGLLGGIYALTIHHIVMAALAFCCLVFASLALRRQIHWVGIAVLVNFGCWILSGVISGGLAAEFLTSKDFWRGEGRCFLFYIPLLAASVVSLKPADLRFIVKLVCVLTIVGLILAALWFGGYGHLFQDHVDEETGEISSDYFVGLQTSHTGAGAFWATITAFLAAYSLKTGERKIQLLAIGAAVLTLATGGRAATLGLLAVVGWLLLQGQLLNRRTLKKTISIAGLVTLGGWGVLASVPEISERMMEVFEASTMQAVATAAEAPTLKNAAGHFYSGAHLENHNIVIRIFLWKYALRLFRNSPLLGVGFGRFNDTNLEFSGPPGVLSLAVDGERFSGCGIQWDEGQLMISTGNAHNSYLHTLAELGIVGLAISLYMWWLMYRYSRPRSAAHTDAFSLAYCSGCRAAIVCLLTASLFGHALAAPSGGVLLTTLVGAWIANRPDNPS